MVLLADVRSVGVQGDGRTYGHPIVLRPVSSEDAMTADWTRVPYEVLERISTRITNEVRRGQPRGAGRHQQAARHHRVGVAPPSCRAATGLDDFGSSYYREGLERTVDAFCLGGLGLTSGAISSALEDELESTWSGE